MGQGLLDIEAAIGAIGRSYASAPVILGGMVLTGIEVPDRLRVGGRQMLAVHRLAGGGRVVDALGNDPDRLELSGRFMGPDAQSRASAVERMRVSGVPVGFSAAGLSATVWIAQFSYDYQAKGAVCAYRLVLERAAESGAPAGSTAFGTLVAGDIGGALSGLTSMIGSVSTGVFTLAGQVGTVVGQVTPVATLLGAGGGIVKATTALGQIGALAQTGSVLATAPASVVAMSDGLAQAGSGLMTTIGQAGANLEGISMTNGGALGAAVQNAGIASAAVDAGGLINRAAAYAASGSDAVYGGPLVFG